MNTRAMKPLTYAAVAELLGSKQTKSLGNNTLLVRSNETTISVQLYNTIVVEIHACGNYTLHHGGWMTVTTKQRINALTPAHVHQMRGEWYVDNTPFADGIIVNGEGKVVA